LIEALEWYRDHGQRLGADPARLGESFSEFAASKGWPAEHQDAAVSVYGLIRDQGPDAVMSPAPGLEEDAATIARASELLRTNPDAYWRDHELQEAQLEALERQEVAPPPPCRRCRPNRAPDRPSRCRPVRRPGSAKPALGGGERGGRRRGAVAPACA